MIDLEKNAIAVLFSENRTVLMDMLDTANTPTAAYALLKENNHPLGIQITRQTFTAAATAVFACILAERKAMQVVIDSLSDGYENALVELNRTQSTINKINVSDTNDTCVSDTGDISVSDAGGTCVSDTGYISVSDIGDTVSRLVQAEIVRLLPSIVQSVSDTLPANVSKLIQTKSIHAVKRAQPDTLIHPDTGIPSRFMGWRLVLGGDGRYRLANGKTTIYIGAEWNKDVAIAKIKKRSLMEV